MRTIITVIRLIVASGAELLLFSKRFRFDQISACRIEIEVFSLCLLYQPRGTTMARICLFYIWRCLRNNIYIFQRQHVFKCPLKCQ